MKTPKFFDQKDFLMNDKWKVTILPLFGSHIIFVDDIYKHPSINSIHKGSMQKPAQS